MKRKVFFSAQSLHVDVLDYMFVEWLVRNNLYSKFVANLPLAEFATEKPRTAIRAIVYHAVTSCHSDPLCMISNAFLFRSTPEGRDFWLEASSAWKTYFTSFTNLI